MEGFSIAKLLVIAGLIVLLFGTNKLRSLGGDLGAAIKGFKKAMKEDTESVNKEHPAENVSESLSKKE